MSRSNFLVVCSPFVFFVFLSCAEIGPNDDEKEDKYSNSIGNWQKVWRQLWEVGIMIDTLVICILTHGRHKDSDVTSMACIHFSLINFKDKYSFFLRWHVYLAGGAFSLSATAVDNPARVDLHLLWPTRWRSFNSTNLIRNCQKQVEHFVLRFLML